MRTTGKGPLQWQVKYGDFWLSSCRYMTASTIAERPAVPAVAARAKNREIVIYALTSFLSAFLLFQVQLIISKYTLPWFGGSAAVWTTSMLVFQVLLLAGYVYSHLISSRLTLRGQGIVHCVLLGLAVLTILVLSIRWPSAITPSVEWRSVGGDPLAKVAFIILVSVGLPFFVLASTAPLLQRWFAYQGWETRTYRLYSVSNFGSLLGLLTFPFLFEPLMHIRGQGILWSALFCGYAALCGWCAWTVRKMQESPSPEPDEAAAAPTSVITRALWVLLPACASALLLATTNILCQEVISLPLLWVIPLALYLLSFILCFDHPRWYRREICHPLFGVGVFLLCAAMIFALRDAQVVLLPIVLFLASMICHGELVRLKPGVSQLTSFYLAISVGGAMGGVFVAVLAPHWFKFFTEFQISVGATVVLLLGCLFLDPLSWLYRSGLWITSSIFAGLLGSVFLAGHWIAPLPAVLQEFRFYPSAVLVGAVVLLGTYLQGDPRAIKRGFRPVQALVCILAILSLVLLVRTAQPESNLYAARRNFYGALRIYELAQGGKALFHGQTLHGAQLDPPNDQLPMAYYGPDSGIGIMLRNHPKRRTAPGTLRVGVVGLGAGTLAAYGVEGDYFRYYEINPDIIELSSGDHPLFTYVRDSAAHVDLEEGDGRLLLAGEAVHGGQNFDVLVLDAFSGDAVPVHLLTKEAFDLYWRHLQPEGVIAIHVSSRHINLLPVLQGLTEQYGASSLVRFAYAGYPFLDNLWVFIAHQADDLRVDGLEPNPPPIKGPVAPRLWTDDYSDILHLLY